MIGHCQLLFGFFYIIMVVDKFRIPVPKKTVLFLAAHSLLFHLLLSFIFMMKVRRRIGSGFLTVRL